MAQSRFDALFSSVIMSDLEAVESAFVKKVHMARLLRPNITSTKPFSK